MHVTYTKRALNDAALQNLRNYFTPVDYINLLINYNKYCTIDSATNCMLILVVGWPIHSNSI